MYERVDATVCAFVTALVSDVNQCNFMSINRLRHNNALLPLTLKAPITTIVVCFVICLWFEKSFLQNSADPDQFDLGPHCLLVCKNKFEKFAKIFSRRHKQTTFLDAVFLGALRVNAVEKFKFEGDWIQLSDIPPNFTREITFMTSCLISYKLCTFRNEV